jgi:hypothetical protein
MRSGTLHDPHVLAGDIDEDDRVAAGEVLIPPNSTRRSVRAAPADNTSNRMRGLSKALIVIGLTIASTKDRRADPPAIFRITPLSSSALRSPESIPRNFSAVSSG